MTIEQDAERYIDGAVETVNTRDWEGYGAFFADDVAMRFPGAIDGSVSGRAARSCARPKPSSPRVSWSSDQWRKMGVRPRPSG